MIRNTGDGWRGILIRSLYGEKTILINDDGGAKVVTIKDEKAEYKE
jgi:hypothetical protein